MDYFAISVLCIKMLCTRLYTRRTKEDGQRKLDETKKTSRCTALLNTNVNLNV